MARNILRMGLAAFIALFFQYGPVGAQEVKDKSTADSNAEKAQKINDRKHPDYIRCRTEPVLGSNAKKRRVCLTNRQWAEVSRDGNAMARDMAETGTSRPNSGQ
ncbi:MAG: hypothetical protein HC843_09855 [Sphingomonadales bacterium]|nr:hypothetical protein [Sphingomonadales bacterium]